jgi:hypothetical protein
MPHTPQVSYELYAHRFHDGESVTDPSVVGLVFGAIAPFCVEAPDEMGHCDTRTPDGGEAEFYVGPDGHGFMVSHFSPGQTTELILRAARSAQLILLGPGLSPVLTDANQLADLPAALAAGDPMPVLVETAAELERLIADDPETYRRCRERLTSRA